MLFPRAKEMQLHPPLMWEARAKANAVFFQIVKNHASVMPLGSRYHVPSTCAAFHCAPIGSYRRARARGPFVMVPNKFSRTRWLSVIRQLSPLIATLLQERTKEKIMDLQGLPQDDSPGYVSTLNSSNFSSFDFILLNNLKDHQVYLLPAKLSVCYLPLSLAKAGLTNRMFYR